MLTVDIFQSEEDKQLQEELELMVERLSVSFGFVKEVTCTQLILITVHTFISSIITTYTQYFAKGGVDIYFLHK